MALVTFTFQKKTFCKRPDVHRDDVYEFDGYVSAANMPPNVPAGCNPRKQNIDKGIYRQIVDSLVLDQEKVFHLKNLGISVLAEEVTEVSATENTISLEVEIPQDLGVVNGAHTYNIIGKFGHRNPDQHVSVKLRSHVPSHLISEIAQALNTNMPVTAASMADHRGLFQGVQDVLKAQPYAEWIGYRQNATGISANSKDLVAMMWVCHPVIPEGRIWQPNWIVTRPGAVFDGFYNPTVEKDEFREHLMKMAPVLPDLIDLFCHITETAFQTGTRSRFVRGGGRENAVRQTEVTRNDLCQRKEGFPFRDPASRQKNYQLRECYRFMILSGLRALLREDPQTNTIRWQEPLPVIRTLLDQALPNIYRAVVQQFRQDRRDHNATSRCSALWNVPQAEIERAYSQWRENRLLQELDSVRRRRPVSATV